jgi:hypothetical protein
MSSLVLNGDTSGSVTVTVPAVAGTNSVTIPAAAGTVMVSGNMPAFSAYLSSATQSITNLTSTKVQLNGKEFDTANCFDSSSNYRFTPNVAGYYQINATIAADATVTNPNWAMVSIYKNGTFYKQARYAGMTYTNISPTVSAVIYLNGSTDYVEMYAYLSGGSGLILDGNNLYQTFFNGALVRAA